MKKILNWYKTGWGYLAPLGKWIVLILMGAVAYMLLEPEMGYFWATVVYFGFMTFLVWKGHMDVREIERRKAFFEKKYGSDPEWEKYKELKKKFRGA